MNSLYGSLLIREEAKIEQSTAQREQMFIVILEPT